jgi:hypothetical protein
MWVICHFENVLELEADYSGQKFEKKRPKKENDHSDSSLHIQSSWLLCYQSCMES